MAATREGALLRAARWLRSYGAVAALLAIVALTFARSLSGAMPPSPEFPPQGYAVETDTIQLQWSSGSGHGEARLEVAADRPDFGGPLFFEKRTKGKTAMLQKLAPGRSYYWRVTIDGRTSRVNRFTVAADALRY